jgi:hypothetical protein
MKREKINISLILLILILWSAGIKGFGQEVKAWKSETKQDVKTSTETQKCGYYAADGTYRILKTGDSYKETRYAKDISGVSHTINVVAKCDDTKKGVLIVTTMDDQPVAIYILKSKQIPVALRVGDIVQDNLYVYDAKNEVKDLPVTITCKSNSAGLKLELSATFDGQILQFYTDAKHLYALKQGERIEGASKIIIKQGFYDKDWYQIDR